jgi:hypothetical protein
MQAVAADRDHPAGRREAAAVAPGGDRLPRGARRGQQCRTGHDDPADG